MTRLITFLLVVLAAAAGLSWLADNPGSITIDWLGYRAEPTVFQAVVIFLLTVMAASFLFTLVRQVWTSPAAVGNYLAKRRQRRGLDALSSGMIAIGAGDRTSAVRHAVQARKSLPNEPLTHLLRAQAAQLSGDRATSRRIFEAMLASPDTEGLGLRGLYLEAQREGEGEAQRQFAERALRLNPKLAWPAEALFDVQCKEGRWDEALETLATSRRYGHMDKTVADRRRAVLLTAQAQGLEESNPDQALTLAMEAHSLAPDLIPAAAIAGRLFAARGSTAKAAKVIQKTWSKAPHPELATAYAYARIGDSPRDRYDRVKQLAALNPHSVESPIAVATAAVEARQFDDARHAISPLLDSRLTRRVAMLMARIEGEQHGDKGRVREWLARAVNAPRDPAWTADGVVSEQWAPTSPVTGALDAFQWRVPVSEAEAPDAEELTARLDRLVALGASGAREIEVGSEADAKDDTNDVATIDRQAAVVVEAEVEDVEPVSSRKAKLVKSREEAPAPATGPAIRPTVARAAPDTLEEAAAAGAAPMRSDAPAQPAPLKTAGKPPKSEKARSEPKIFVAPPAPDDPGAEEEDDTTVRSLKPPYRAIS